MPEPKEEVIGQYAGGATVAFRSNSMLARCSAVRDGIGLGFLPCFLANTERNLIRLGDVIPEASATLWILVHADLRRNGRVRSFVEYTHAALLLSEDRLSGRAWVCSAARARPRLLRSTLAAVFRCRRCDAGSSSSTSVLEQCCSRSAT